MTTSGRARLTDRAACARGRAVGAPSALAAVAVIAAAGLSGVPAHAAPGAAQVSPTSATQPRPTVPPLVTTTTAVSYRIVRLQTLDENYPSAVAAAGAPGGLIVGQSYSAELGGERATVWDPDGTIHDLGTLGGSTAVASDVSPSGVVVGQSARADSSSDAFRWTASGGMRALPRPARWQGAFAVAVSRRGVVVGTGFDADYAEQGLVWRPGTTAPQVVSSPLRRTIAVGVDDAGNAYFRTTRLVADSSPADGAPPDQLLRVPPSGPAVDLLADLSARDVALRLAQLALNDAGQVIAVVDGHDDPGAHVYRWDGDDPTPISLGLAVDPWQPVAAGPDGSLAWARQRPESTDDEVARYAVVRKPSGTIVALEGLDTRGAMVTALGPGGTAVGEAPSYLDGTYGGPRAVVWRSGAEPVDLTATPELPAGGLSTATAVLADGRILGRTGRTNDGSGVGDLGVVWVPEKHARTVVRLRPIADTYVDQANPGGIFGRTSSLAAVSAPADGTSRRAFLRFALPTAPAGTRLVSATLRVHTTPVSYAGSLQRTPITASTGGWSELGTWWLNRPADSSVERGVLKPAGPDQDTTGRLPVGMIQPGTQLDLALSGSRDSLWVWSRDYARDAARPGLVLTYEATD